MDALFTTARWQCLRCFVIIEKFYLFVIIIIIVVVNYNNNIVIIITNIKYCDTEIEDNNLKDFTLK